MHFLDRSANVFFRRLCKVYSPHKQNRNCLESRYNLHEPSRKSRNLLVYNFLIKLDYGRADKGPLETCEREQKESCMDTFLQDYNGSLCWCYRVCRVNQQDRTCDSIDLTNQFGCWISQFYIIYLILFCC